MNLKEYEAVKNMTYLDYCDYLQRKYGIGLSDYMTKSYNRNQQCSRTKDGLFAHHKMEDHAIMLSVKEYAKQHPIEWQSKENIVYCDYLEHLLLHVMICKYPDPSATESVGIGGIVSFLIPELNSLYSGCRITQNWKRKCFEKVRYDKDVYILILKEFTEFVKLNHL